MPENCLKTSSALKMQSRNKENILVVIAARGGSKGIKNKNIRPLAGKPLIAHTIQQAVRWAKATDIICSTDSKKIAEIAKRYGAAIPFIRPESLSTDNVGKTEVVRHALARCEDLYKKTYDIVVDLDATAPIRKISDLDNCLEFFKEKKPKTLFSVVKSRRNPYFNMVEEKKDGRVALCKSLEKPIMARQNAPSVYDLNSSIYFYRRDYLLDRANTTVISDDTHFYVMDEVSAFDIDREIDFKFVEFLMKERFWQSET